MKVSFSRISKSTASIASIVSRKLHTSPDLTMSSPTIYLITGANRGIGQGLVATYLARPHNTVIAAVRDPAHPSAKALATLPKGQSSSLIVVKIDSCSETDAATAVKTLESEHGITSLDTVIANAGISLPKGFGPIASVKVVDVKEHVDVNAIGTLLLFQATLPLLNKATHGPGKFVTVSSPIGSIGGMEQRPFPMAAYGASKAMLNYLTRKIHFEHEDLIAFALDPGFVQTDLGNTGAAFFGMKEATTPTKDSVEGMVKAIDGATREKTSGHFPDFEGGEFPW